MESLSGLLPIVIIIAAFYFLFIRPSQARKRQQAQMQTTLVAGVRVMTTSGIFGTVRVVEGDVIHVEIAPNVVIEMVPAAVGRVIVPASAEASSGEAQEDGI
ncbi:MAG: preprotein translocase subunit YajC [Actinomycetota bacterium]|nr:preprotein translocase subunit YajC [Actinomycetota bacterium]